MRDSERDREEDKYEYRKDRTGEPKRRDIGREENRYYKSGEQIKGETSVPNLDQPDPLLLGLPDPGLF